MSVTHVAGPVVQIKDRVIQRCMVCPEQARALNALDEAMMLFNAAIARNEPVTGAG